MVEISLILHGVSMEFETPKHDKYIVNGLRKILKDKFKKDKKIFFKNPYYCKNSSIKIINFLKQNRNKKFKLLNKQYN